MHIYCLRIGQLGAFFLLFLVTEIIYKAKLFQGIRAIIGPRISIFIKPINTTHDSNNYLRRFILIFNLIFNFFIFGAHGGEAKPMCLGLVSSVERIQPLNQIPLNRKILNGKRITLVPITLEDVGFLEELEKTDIIAKRYGIINPSASIKLATKIGSQSREWFAAGWIVYFNGIKIGYRFLRRFYDNDFPNDIKTHIKTYLHKNKLPEIHDNLFLYSGGIFLPEHRGHGFGPESLALVKDFAASHLQATLVLVKVSSSNLYSIKAVQKAGFYKVEMPLEPEFSTTPYGAFVLNLSGPAFYWFTSLNINPR